MVRPVIKIAECIGTCPRYEKGLNFSLEVPRVRLSENCGKSFVSTSLGYSVLEWHDVPLLTFWSRGTISSCHFVL